MHAQTLNQCGRNRLTEPRQGQDQGRSADPHQRRLVERPFRRPFDASFTGDEPLQADSRSRVGGRKKNRQALVSTFPPAASPPLAAFLRATVTMAGRSSLSPIV